MESFKSLHCMPEHDTPQCLVLITSVVQQRMAEWMYVSVKKSIQSCKGVIWLGPRLVALSSCSAGSHQNTTTDISPVLDRECKCNSDAVQRPGGARGSKFPLPEQWKTVGSLPTDQRSRQMKNRLVFWVFKPSLSFIVNIPALAYPLLYELRCMAMMTVKVAGRQQKS